MAALERGDEPAPLPFPVPVFHGLAHALRTRPRPLNARDLAAIASYLGPATQPPARGPQGVQP